MRNPVTGDELTAEWLTTALARLSGGARVLTVRAEPMPTRDALFTGPDRLHLTWDRDGLPATLVAKAVADDHVAAEMGAAMGVFEREAGFYADLADGCGVRIAAPWFVWSRRDSTLLLLEDLGELRGGDGRQGLEVAEVEATLLALAPMHAKWWGSTALDQLAFLRRDDDRLDTLGEQCRALIDTFVGRCAAGWTDAEVDVVRSVGADAAGAWRPLFHDGVTLAHGDVKPGNLFFDDMEPVFVDWQAAAVASPAIDVVSILGCGLPHEVRRANEAVLIERYTGALRDSGIEIDEGEWRAQLARAARAMLTPCIAAAGVADDRLARTLEVTARRRADLALALAQN